MLKTSFLKSVLIGCSMLVSGSLAAAQMVPSPPEINARGYVLMDYRSGEIIAASNPEKQMAPASLTKMMTAYIIGQELNEQRLSFADPVHISNNAWSRKFPDSSKMFIKPGDKVTVADLTRGIMVQSGNDACVAMAEHVAGSEDAFVSLMNSWAQQLGMVNSRFVNAHGLDGEGIATTPLDMAVLLKSLIRDTPQIYKIYGEKSFTWADISQQNRNRLLWDESLKVDGGKTGYTSDAGYSLAASAVGDDEMRLITVVMGTASANARIQETRKLMNFGFRFYASDRVASKHVPLMQTRVWMGAQKNVPITVAEDVFATVRRTEKGKLQAEYQLNGELTAPLSAGQVVGVARWRSGDLVVREVPLIAGQAVAEGGLVEQLMDRVMMLVDGLIKKVMAAIF